MDGGFAVSLDDKYVATSGRIYVNGTQALTRLPISQHQLDVKNGLNTAGFISGYRGSPLSTYDQDLWRARKHLQAHNIHFQAGLNEEIAATSVWGSQQVGLFGKAKFDGVFGLWYAKNPGLDRAGDAMKHGNYAGTSRHGGVLVVIGDDPAAKSATIPNQCEYTFIGQNIPVVAPSDLQDVLDLGMLGWGLSRYSGCWVGFKVEPNVIERSASIEIGPDRIQYRTPTDFQLPPDGVNIRWPDDRFSPEVRLWDHKLPAAEAFARANGINRTLFSRQGARLGIVTSGKAYLDVREALDELGIDEARARQLGIAVLKLGMVWPLEKTGAREFAEGLQEILVIEEKGPVVEEQLRSLLYHMPADRRPRIVGKTDENGRPMLTPILDFHPTDLARLIGRRVAGLGGDAEIGRRCAAIDAREGEMVVKPSKTVRSAFFCSGCPHNSSIKHPEGSRNMGGIGCHWMAVWVPELTTEPSVQMGGEGTNWIGQAPFMEDKHVFQNLGDGTYYHSGLMAIRAAVASGVNITYKILYNDAVAMTGGQAVDGKLTVSDITRQLWAEGVKRIVVVTDEPEKYQTNPGPAHAGLAPGVTVHHRSELIAIQKELSEIKGTTGLVYDQTCAAEKRRRRKRKEFPDPPKRMFINESVCEGCGDCSVASNCIAIEPLETEFGRKRAINQQSCNKDYSCNTGFCPSFVTVNNAKLRRREAADLKQLNAALAQPALPKLDQPFNLVVTGIGGTGVVTIGALLGMAAHLEGKGCSVLDSIGLAQKNGPVISYIRIAERPDQLHTPRVPVAAADVLIACDIVIATGKDALSTLRRGRTKAIVNTHVAPTSEFVHHRDMQMDPASLADRIADAVGKGDLDLIDSQKLAVALLGDAMGANVFMLGVAYQLGRLPVSQGALERAIELNGVSIEMNKQAFTWGRMAVVDRAAVERLAGLAPEPAVTSLDPVERRVEFLTQYQNKAYGERYRAFVERVRQAEQSAAAGSTRLTDAVARYYFKLLAYKDEYEVARLHSDPAFHAKLKSIFEDGFTLEFNLAPPVVSGKDKVTGNRVKRTFGPWMLSFFRLLAKGKALRGTPFDLFGLQHERRLERQLIRDYETDIERLLATLDRRNLDAAVEIASLPDEIRGYGHVKAKAIAEAKQKRPVLLERFAKGPPMPASSAAE